MILGHENETHEPVLMNIDKLIETRLLIQANSGAGKSWCIRRVLEQTHGKVQQIVIDVEDEFATLREKYDYVLAGNKAADCPAHPGCAAMLARRLLELNVSAIIGIYELKQHERISFVRRFLDALVNVDKSLWHPAMIVIDEAHIFAPQNGHAESASAVIDLQTRGRKRGFCGILATQRISKLHKDAAAEANNKLIGRSALDVDMKRAADELGFTQKTDQAMLRNLEAGQFFAFGPAITNRITMLQIGTVQTSHPKAGQRAIAPPPPRGKVLGVLAQLADLPREAEQEAKTVAELQVKIRELERAQRAPATDKAAIERAVEAERRRQESIVDGLRKRLSDIARLASIEASPAVTQIKTKVHEISVAATALRQPQPVKSPVNPVFNDDSSDDTSVNAGEKKILKALAQYEKMDKKRLALVSGFSVNSGTFGTYLSNLKRLGHIRYEPDRIVITASGLTLLGDFDPLPIGDALLQYWMRELGGDDSGYARILRALQVNHPTGLSKQSLAEMTGFSSNSGTFGTYLSKLRTLQLINRGDPIKLDDSLVG